MSTILRTTVNIACHSLGRYRHSFKRFRTEALLERLLEGGDAEYAVCSGTRYSDSDFGASLRHEHADQRIARCRVRKFLVPRLIDLRKLDFRNDLIGLERSLKQSLE